MRSHLTLLAAFCSFLHAKALMLLSLIPHMCNTIPSRPALQTTPATRVYECCISVSSESVSFPQQLKSLQIKDAVESNSQSNSIRLYYHVHRADRHMTPLAPAVVLNVSMQTRNNSRSGVLRTQKLRIPLLKTHSSKVVLLKPRFGQNIATNALLASRDFCLSKLYLSGAPFTFIFF